MKLSKDNWRRIGIVSVAVFCLVLVINFALLYKIYGCVGAMDEPVMRHGICSDQGLKTVEIITKVFQVLIWASLAGIVIGFIKAGQKKD